MTTPHLPEVEGLVEDLADSIGHGIPGPNATWQVRGPATAGKSAMLGMLADRLHDRDLVPIMASPPPGSLDAGPCAITELATGLKQAGAVNGQTDALRDPSRPLFEKLALVREWIEDARDRVVVLLDEPAAWPDRSEQTGHFAEHARVVVYELVRDLACRRVVTGEMPEALRASDSRRIESRSHADAFLGEGDGWGGLSEAAADLWEMNGDGLSRFSPLELRLLVALMVVTSAETVTRMLAERVSRRRLSQRLAESLEGSERHAELLTAWRSLAEIRRPFSEDLLARTIGDLSDVNDELLRRCLLYRRSSKWVLHETLRRDVTPDPATGAERLRELAGHYAAESRAAVADPNDSGLVPAMESLFYSARAGMRESPIGDPFFVDQLDLLGKTLSYEQRDYGGAAEVFSRAVAIDDTDDYAHHYLAFNLDRLGREPGRVESHYLRAVDLDSRHPWWRARLVSFLIVRGRVSEAETAWDDALDALGPLDDYPGIAIYETLHGWVAATLLRRGLLEFAERVLDDVPPSARRDSSAITALIRRLRAMQLADRDGAFVPGQFSSSEWWNDGPFLLQERLDDDDRLRLRRWLAGRVQSIGPHEIELRVKEIDVTDSSEPPIATLRLGRDVFDRLNRDRRDRAQVGAFVEIGLYSEPGGERPTRTIRVHAERDWRDESIPAPIGPGDRYWSAESMA